VGEMLVLFNAPPLEVSMMNSALNRMTVIGAALALETVPALDSVERVEKPPMALLDSSWSRRVACPLVMTIEGVDPCHGVGACHA